MSSSDDRQNADDIVETIDFFPPEAWTKSGLDPRWVRAEIERLRDLITSLKYGA